MSAKIDISELTKKFAHHGELAPQEIRDLLDHATDLTAQSNASLAAVENVCAAWTARGEHDMAFSKTVPYEDAAMALLTSGAEMVEKARIIRAAITSATIEGATP